MSKKTSPGLGSNQIIRDAIQKIALRGVIDTKTGAIIDACQSIGYVTAIHTDGEFTGTVDVTEYRDTEKVQGEDESAYLHVGVLLSAIQNNDKGLLIVPKLYSDVVVTRDPLSGKEFVTMYSHVDIVQIDSHESVIVEVKEREEFNDKDENSPDIDELAETGVHARTVYQKNSIQTDVHGDKDENVVTSVIDDTHVGLDVSNGKTSVNIDKDNVNVIRDKSQINVDKDAVESKSGNSLVRVENGKVYLGSTTGTDDAVLGSELADILCDILNYISQIQTTTQLGPQPPLNLASFITLKAKINAFKAAHSGFLTNKVQIQK